MTSDGDEPAGDPVADHERHQLRPAWWLLGIGAVLGMLGAAAVGVAGASGQAGFVALMLVWGLTAAVTGLQVLLVAFVDDVRRRPVTRRRVVVALGLLAGAFVLFVMAFGAAT